MAVLSDTDLQAFSDLATDLALKDRCAILRKAMTQDAQGGYSETWPPLYTNIPCLVVDARFPAQQIIAEQLTDRMDKIISFPRQQDVLNQDRIQVGSVFYHVLGVVEPSTYEVLRRVVVTREDVPR